MVPSTFDLKIQTQMDYHQAIQSLGGWDFVNVPQFPSGFYAFVQLPNGVTYATKGDSYVRYSNKRIAYVEQWGMGSLPENFRSEFDAIALYLTKWETLCF